MKTAAFLSSVLLIISAFCVEIAAQDHPNSRVNITIVTDEAEAVLAILERRERSRNIIEADWKQLFSSEGYVRIKKRNLSFNRPFEEADFKKFVLSDSLAKRRTSLTETLAKWKKADAKEAGNLALDYLPENSRIEAKIYPVIKPRKNSYVFEIDTDPGIFLYLDPKMGKEQFENTLAHELHHIGFGSSCPTQNASKRIKKLPLNSQRVLRWIGAFGEGFAMLAAAGGPNSHPHAFSPKDDKKRWDKDIANFNTDLKKVENFFLDLSKGTLSDKQELEIARSFYGIQGPWYTVGWKMAIVIEKTFGREKLIDCMCDNQTLLSTYNKAVKKYNRRNKDGLVQWSKSLVEKLS